jgi:hypothetical protein
LDDVPPCNFNSAVNHQQKVFDKFPMMSDENREGACGSEMVHEKNGDLDDNNLYLHPSDPALRAVFDRADMQEVPLAPNLHTSLSCGALSGCVTANGSARQWRNSTG